MIIDTSALLAIMLKEPERALYVSTVTGSRTRISAASYVEAAMKLIAEGVSEPNEKLSATLEGLEIVLVPIDAEQARVAVEARLRFGKGRHPAGLNYGDCFAYALAKVTGEPLLYKGDDFAQTDVRSAL